MEISAMSEARKYVIHHYGNLISVNKPEFDSDNKTWVAELKSDYPRIIHDDKAPNERILKFLCLPRLGTIKMKENFEIVDATSRDTCVENLSCFLNMWQERAERIIIKASSDNLANINEARWVLSKIGTIISLLKFKSFISDNELDSLPPKDATRLRRYLELLESLSIVSRKEEGYSYGNTFTELSYKANNDFEKLSTYILSHIIKERYSALREVFGISQLETFVHVDSCYYRPALEAEHLIYWNIDSFMERYAMLYGKRSKACFRLPYILDELVHVNALKYEDKFYFGNKELFKEMQNLRYEMPELASSRA